MAIDGKTARGSKDRGHAALHMVSAFVCRRGITLGQWKTDDHSNEITAVPESIDALDLKGATVTLDAMGCQKAIAQSIVGQDADYVFGLKGNQGMLHEEVKRLFDVMQWQHDAEFENWGNPELTPSRFIRRSSLQLAQPSSYRHACSPQRRKQAADKANGQRPLESVP